MMLLDEIYRLKISFTSGINFWIAIIFDIFNQFKLINIFIPSALWLSWFAMFSQRWVEIGVNAGVVGNCWLRPGLCQQFLAHFYYFHFQQCPTCFHLCVGPFHCGFVCHSSSSIVNFWNARRPMDFWRIHVHFVLVRGIRQQIAFLLPYDRKKIHYFYWYFSHFKMSGK